MTQRQMESSGLCVDKPFGVFNKKSYDSFVRFDLLDVKVYEVHDLTTCNDLNAYFSRAHSKQRQATRYFSLRFWKKVVKKGKNHI